MRPFGATATARVIEGAIDAAALRYGKNKLALLFGGVIEWSIGKLCLPALISDLSIRPMAFGVLGNPRLDTRLFAFGVHITPTLACSAAFLSYFVRMRLAPCSTCGNGGVLMRVIPALALGSHLVRICLGPLAVIFPRGFRISGTFLPLVFALFLSVERVGFFPFDATLGFVALVILTLLGIEFGSIGLFPGTQIGLIAWHEHLLQGDEAAKPQCVGTELCEGS